MSNIIPTLGANKKSTGAPGKARPNISKLISDDIFIENEFDLSCLMCKIPKKQSVLEKGENLTKKLNTKFYPYLRNKFLDDVWSFSQILSQLIVEIENERSYQPAKKTDFMPLQGSE